jgi:hypothetical protein
VAALAVVGLVAEADRAEVASAAEGLAELAALVAVAGLVGDRGLVRAGSAEGSAARGRVLAALAAAVSAAQG